jgi:mitochondrial fission protein ELM1
MRPCEVAIDSKAARWKQRLAELQRPLMALFVGGQTKPSRCTAEVAVELMEAALRTYCF